MKGDATADGTLIDPYLRRLEDADGNNLPGTSNDNANDMLNSQLLFTPEQSGSYYIQIRSATQEGYAATGTYTVSIKLEGAAEEEQTDWVAAGPSTIVLLGVGGEVEETIDYFADEDWFKVVLTAGTKYAIMVVGGLADDSLTLEIPWLFGLFDAELQPLLMRHGDGHEATERTRIEGVDGVAFGYHRAANDGTMCRCRPTRTWAPTGSACKKLSKLLPTLWAQGALAAAVATQPATKILAPLITTDPQALGRRRLCKRGALWICQRDS